jgi:transcriptional repressor NrdR
MVCIHCGHKTQVVNSRLQKRNNQVWRRRHCLQCGALFTTQEAALYGASWSVRGKDGSLQPFLRDKLLLSLYRSCQHRPQALRDAAGLADTVIKKIGSEVKAGAVEASIIAQAAQVALNRFDTAASTHYQAFHKD